jgi:L-Ala-D/L-Glu epimerase
MALEIQHSAVRLALRNAFNLAHGSSDARTNLLVRIEEGWGEVPVVPYYGRTPEELAGELRRAQPLLGDDPARIEGILAAMESAGIAPAVRCGIDLALHDLAGKRAGIPLHRHFGLDPARIPPTSFTIAIDRPEAMAERARASGMPILKLKLGREGDADLVAVRAVRAASSARLRLDANGGWTREQAARLIPLLQPYDIELIEQPLARDDVEGLAWLRPRVQVPLFADESLQSERDLAALRPGVDGIVVKLMKSGGLLGALRLIRAARALDLGIMLSCMIESSLGVTAAAHLAPLADFVDLDGPLLIANDPFRGIRYEGAVIRLPSAPGIGALPVQPPRT